MLAPAFTESQAETMPWGEVHTYEPPDYEALIRYVCECEQQAQHVPALSGVLGLYGTGTHTLTHISMC